MAKMAEWHRKLQPRYHTKHGSFSRYLAVDVETTGFSKDDLVVSIGHCYANGKTSNGYDEIILNWADYDQSIVPIDWLTDRLGQCRYNMTKSTGTWHGVTVDVMRHRGVPVLDAIERCYKVYQRCRDHDYLVLGHNFHRFDCGKICELLLEFGGINWSWAPEEIWDTYLVEKAICLGLAPSPNEPVTSFFDRVRRARSKGCKARLSDCAARYRLVDKYRVDEVHFHSAGFDALMCHLLMLEHLALISKV